MKGRLIFAVLVLSLFSISFASAYSFNDLVDDIISSIKGRFTGHAVSWQRNITVWEGSRASLSCDPGDAIKNASAVYWCPDGTGRRTTCNTDSALGENSYSFDFNNPNCGGDPCQHVRKKGNLTISCGDSVACSDYDHETLCLEDDECEWVQGPTYSMICQEKVEDEEVSSDCIDVDGSEGYYVKNNITWKGSVVGEDRCFKDGSNLLIEMGCSSDGRWTQENGYSCPNGCLDGACLPEPSDGNSTNASEVFVEEGNVSGEMIPETEPEVANSGVEPDDRDFLPFERQSSLTSKEDYRSSREWTSCSESEEGIVSEYIFKFFFWKFTRSDDLANTCKNQDTLLKYSCNGWMPVQEEYDCSSGCLDGECVGDVGETESFVRIVQLGEYFILEDRFIKVSDSVLEMIVELEEYSENVEIVLAHFSGEEKSFLLSQKDNPLEYGGFLDFSSEEISGDYFFRVALNGEGAEHVWTLFSSESRSFRSRPVSLGIIDGRLLEPLGEGISENCKSIWYTGDSEENLDLVFVGDKYGDLAEFRKDMEDFSRDLLTEPTWEAYKDRINLWRIDELSSFGCKHTKDCAAGILKPIVEETLFEHSTIMCCDADSAKESARNNCPTDHVVLIEESSIDGGTVYLENPLLMSSFSPFKYTNMILIGDISKRAGVSTSTSVSGGRTVLHELGHLIARLPDYYDEDPYCENHPCMMCSHYYDLGDEDLCIDRAKMVEQFNQFCGARVDVFNKNPTSPYPNPFDPSEGQTQKVKYKVDYPDGGDPCYILMHVYNSEGKETRVLVSDEPQIEGEYIFEWNGKDNLGQDAASGVYFYKVSGGWDYDSESVKGTLLK